MNKSTTDEIRKRFDNDVERFSNLDTGQVATIDAQISLELITEAAKRIKPDAKNLLDIGCGAGNYTLKMLSKIPDLNCTLVDLSMPMLAKARERVTAQTTTDVTIIQAISAQPFCRKIISTFCWQALFFIICGKIQTGNSASKNFFRFFAQAVA